MITPKLFKPSDPQEFKLNAAMEPVAQILNSDHDNFWNGAYHCFKLGEILYDEKVTPFAGVILRENFRVSFFTFSELLSNPGTFDFYTSVFQAIWGEDVDIEFTVPSPGVLEIDIEASSLSLDTAMARNIIDNAYVYDEIVTSDGGDSLVFQVPQGIKTQQEVDALIQEIAVQGVYTTATLVIT